MWKWWGLRYEGQVVWVSCVEAELMASWLVEWAVLSDVVAGPPRELSPRRTGVEDRRVGPGVRPEGKEVWRVLGE
ncbi:protein of unknown function [Nocardia cyriacigeorgica GUH-2]|uniref:Uncharacterized protein n=1 Tax=Nocardia cyriacigeorgica (strain GUH-2) TaxID=1127134 RepID=H6R956_NOCCG|nr:protein of unknown function [Nocardia cyriacigeorgica GUH-2]